MHGQSINPIGADFNSTRRLQEFHIMALQRIRFAYSLNEIMPAFDRSVTDLKYRDSVEGDGTCKVVAIFILPFHSTVFYYSPYIPCKYLALEEHGFEMFQNLRETTIRCTIACNIYSVKCKNVRHSRDILGFHNRKKVSINPYICIMPSNSSKEFINCSKRIVSRKA